MSDFLTPITDLKPYAHDQQIKCKNKYFSSARYHLQVFKQINALSEATQAITLSPVQRVIPTRMTAGNDRSANRVAQIGETKIFLTYISVIHKCSN